MPCYLQQYNGYKKETGRQIIKNLPPCFFFVTGSEKSAELAFHCRILNYLTPKCSNRTFSASAFQRPLWALQHSSSFL